MYYTLDLRRRRARDHDHARPHAGRPGPPPVRLGPVPVRAREPVPDGAGAGRLGHRRGASGPSPSSPTSIRSSPRGRSATTGPGGRGRGTRSTGSAGPRPRWWCASCCWWRRSPPPSGYRARLSSAVAVVCMLALQRTNVTIFNSGDLVLRQIGIAVALAPSGLVLSLDALRGASRKRRARRIRRTTRLRPAARPWATRLLQLEIAVGYSLSCWAKLRGSTWHEGTALALALRISDLHRFTPPGSIFHQAVLLNLLTWATLALRGLVHLPRVEPAVPAVGARPRGAVPPRHRPVLRRRVLQLGDVDRLPGLPAPGGGRPGRRPDRRPAAPRRPRPRDRRRRRQHRRVSVRRFCCRSSQPSRTATARGSWRRRCPAPLMMRSSASPWASTSTRASKAGTRSSSLPWSTSIGRGRHLRRVGHGPQLAQLPAPGLDARREERVVDHADVAGVLEEPPRVGGPVVEVGRGAQRGDALDVGVVGRRADRPARRRCRTRRSTRR